jgi:hypothetical protein
VPSATPPRQARRPGRVAVGAHADLNLAEHLLKSQGLPCQRRREEGGDIVDTRDPDRTHVLLVWLDGAHLAGNRLLPRLYASSEPGLALAVTHLGQERPEALYRR